MAVVDSCPFVPGRGVDSGLIESGHQHFGLRCPHLLQFSPGTCLNVIQGQEREERIESTRDKTKVFVSRKVGKVGNERGISVVSSHQVFDPRVVVHPGSE